jgi:hypothetical protein
LPASSQYAVDPEPALQVNVTVVPVNVEFGVGEVICPCTALPPNARIVASPVSRRKMLGMLSGAIGDVGVSGLADRCFRR